MRRRRVSSSACWKLASARWPARVSNGEVLVDGVNDDVDKLEKSFRVVVVVECLKNWREVSGVLKQ